MKNWTIIIPAVLVLACCLTGTLKAQNLYVGNWYNGNIGEYTTGGMTVNASLISGVYSDSSYIAISGNDLFLGSEGGNLVGEYTTSGATVNASLIPGLLYATGIAISGNDLFVANTNPGTVGEYTTSGATVNASLITGLSGPVAIAISPVPEPSAELLALLAAPMLIGRRLKNVA